jgi:hypothetical protein
VWRRLLVVFPDHEREADSQISIPKGIPRRDRFQALPNAALKPLDNFNSDEFMEGQGSWVLVRRGDRGVLGRVNGVRSTYRELKGSPFTIGVGFDMNNDVSDSI